MNLVLIREQDPLKQGLKQHNITLADGYIMKIREQDPLKQGLKHQPGSCQTRKNENSRARSTKTRIETTLFRTYNRVPGIIREQDPLKQGLKLAVM